jgi:hypothetical protein
MLAGVHAVVVVEAVVVEPKRQKKIGNERHGLKRL